MPHFDEFGGDQWICQGPKHTGNRIQNSRVRSEWRPDITGSSSAGNVCPTCVVEPEPKQEETVLLEPKCRKCNQKFDVHFPKSKIALLGEGKPATEVLSADEQRWLFDQVCDSCHVNPPVPQIRVLTTKNGRTVETPYTDKEMVERLGKLTGLRSDFSLDIQRKRHNLKGDQIIWGHIFVVDSETPKAPRVRENVGDLKKIVDMFDAARAKHSKKLPKIHLQLNGIEISFHVAGAMSKYPGTIQVCRTDNRDWLGRIELDGSFVQSNRCQPLPGLVDFIRSFAADPLKVAAQYGHLTNRCCFCHRKLSDEGAGKSVEMGYGPICADKFGLVWG